MELTAAQHVYSSVKRDQSPSKRQGYQTLYYTYDQLERSEVEAIEARCIYYALPDYAPVKYQFYTLPTGKAVVGCIRSIPELDEFGRKGMYLAHNFIFDDTTWQQLHANPFAILDDLRFFSTLGEAQQHGDQNTGNLAAIALEIKNNQQWLDHALGLARQWSSSRLSQLVPLAKTALTNQSQHQPLALIGQEDQILDLLRIVFLVASPQERAYCSFDTYANGCDWTRTQIFFWGQGFSTLEGWKLPGSIKVATQQIQAASDSLPTYALYIQWLQRLLSSDQIPANFHEQQFVISSFEGLEANQPLQPSMLAFADTPTFRELLPRYQSILDRRFLVLFSEKLTNYSTLGQALTKIDHLEKLRMLVASPKPTELASYIYKLICDNALLNLSIEDASYEDLLKLAETEQGLKILLLVEDKRWKDWQATLNQLTSEQYEKFCKDLASYLAGNTWVALCTKHFDYWLRHIFPRHNPTQLNSILDVLETYVGKAEVEKFAEIIPDLSKQDCQAINYWLETNPKVLMPVRKAFERLIKEQLTIQQAATSDNKPESQEKNWLGRLGQIFTPLNRPDKTDQSKQPRKKQK